MIIIIMGVSGCGKTTVGKALAKATNIPFYDADDFHPDANVKKMGSGIPLQDEDRWPWLEALSNKAVEWEKEGGAVLACSALKESYREVLSSKNEVKWVHLVGSMEVIEGRMNARKGHFMKSNMLQSQFDTLESPDYALEVPIAENLNKKIKKITDTFSLTKQSS